MSRTPTPAPTPEQLRAGWDRIAEGFDEHVTPGNIALCEGVLDRIGLGSGSRFLDVASGSGALAIAASRRGARVTAVDLSPAMIERLDERARGEGFTDIDARVMDGRDLAFDDDSFDVTGSQHGVSTFPDFDTGLRELVRVTRPGGQVILIAFGPLEEAEFIAYFLASARAAAPNSTAVPSEPPLPFQVADPDFLAARMRDAGLHDVRVDAMVWSMDFRSASHLWTVVTNSNPIAARIAAALPAERVLAAQEVLDGMLRERSGGRPGATLHTGINVGLGSA